MLRRKLAQSTFAEKLVPLLLFLLIVGIIIALLMLFGGARSNFPSVWGTASEEAESLIPTDILTRFKIR